jgi:hypothetical protein
MLRVTFASDAYGQQLHGTATTHARVSAVRQQTLMKQRRFTDTLVATTRADTNAIAGG